MKQHADLVVTSAKIYNSGDSIAVFSAMAIKDGKIVATGSADEIHEQFSASEVIAADSQFIFPGFIDAHCHFYGLALTLRWADLNGAGSFEEVLQRVREHAEKFPDEWIAGRGWDHNLWGEKRFPDKKELDRLYPDRPVVLVRVDGHVLLANSEAMRRLGITVNHRYHPGEVEIVGGDLTGILGEKAADDMKALIPEPGSETMKDLLKQAEAICFSFGLTGVTDAGLDRRQILFIDTMQQGGEIKIHVNAMLNPTSENYREYVLKGVLRKEGMSVGSIKIYADGSLGSRTALLKQPYADDPSKSGVPAITADSLRKVCALALEHGYRVHTHCIGDSAVAMVLHVYSEFLKGKNDLRWRIEHAQVVSPEDIPLFGKFSIIPSVQATHATSDMYWATDRLGPERIRGAYAYRELLEQNGWLPNGTDFPIEQVNPLLTFYAAVARKDLTGYPDGGFQPENALTREQALNSITLWAAKANDDEAWTGSLSQHKWADFVILDQDIMKIPIEKVPATQVVGTFIHGKRVK